MQIFVKTLVGKRIEVSVDASETVQQLKRILQEKEGIDADQMKLIYAGKNMNEDQTVGSYNITAGNQIHMVIQLRGGL
jgi:ubiquitin